MAIMQAAAVSSGLIRRLRARAHALHPIVMIGESGLSAEVLREIDRNLNAHELIKIRAGSHDRQERAQMLEQVCAQLSAIAVQHIGKMLVVYREKPQAERHAHGKKHSTKPA